jgi:hypothetical protein
MGVRHDVRDRLAMHRQRHELPRLDGVYDLPGSVAQISNADHHCATA